MHVCICGGVGGAVNERIIACDRMAESACNSSVLLLLDLLANRLRISKISAECTVDRYV